MRVHLIDVGQQHGPLDGVPRCLFQRRADLNETLELLVVTHPHIDHVRGIKSVWDAYHVKNVVTDGLTTSSGGVQQANLLKRAKAAGVGLEAVRRRRFRPRV